MAEERKNKRIWEVIIKALYAGAWPIIIFTVIIGFSAFYYSYNYLTMKTSRDELVSSDQRLIRLSREMDRRFGSLDNLVVVVDNTNLARSIHFADALAAELRQYPKHFQDIFYRVDPDRFKKWALLYLEPQDLRKYKAKLYDHRREMEAMAADPRLFRFFQVVNEEITRGMIKELFTGFLKPEEEKEKIPSLDLLLATLQQLDLHLSGSSSYASPLKSIFPGEITDSSQVGYFLTDNDKYLLLLITTEHDAYSGEAQNVQLLRQLVDRVKARFPGIQVGVTGSKALEADEMSNAMADIGFASSLSLICQMALITLFFRSLKRALVQGLVLFMGLVWTFGAATLVVGNLNILSIVFGPLLLGIAVDFGIHWYARLEEEQGQQSRVTMANLICTMRQATPGILYAALTALVSVAPLIFTGFKGLVELGLIISMGILLHIFLSLGFLPALAVATERHRREAAPELCEPQPQPFLSLRWERPRIIVFFGLIVMAIGVLSLWHVHFDLNPLHLQNPKTESVVWELKLIEGSKYSTSYGMMEVNDPQKLQRVTQTLKKLETVSHVESVFSFLPADVADKQRLIAELQPLVAGTAFPAVPPAATKPAELAPVLGRIHFKLSQAEASDWKPEDRPTQEQLTAVNRLLLKLAAPLSHPEPQTAARLAAFEKMFIQDLSDTWKLLQDNVLWSQNPPGLQDLPTEVRRRFVSPDGHYLVRIFPAQDVWNPEPLGRFVRDLRSVDRNVVGDPILLYKFTTDFRNACLWAAGMALAGITMLVFLLLRSWKLTLLALIPLAVGTALTLSLMWLFDLPFNQANVLFLPLILGEGVEYGIIILARWQLEASARAITLPASIAKGVLLAALTTALGFGSLMVSGHRGIFSLGLLSAIGSLSVLLAALSILPAFLRLLREHARPPV